MNRITVSFATLSLALSTIAATPAIAVATATPPAIVHVTRHHSTVHDVHGQRFDVPNSLLRNRDTLINGLPPQPSQFD